MNGRFPASGITPAAADATEPYSYTASPRLPCTGRLRARLSFSVGPLNRRSVLQGRGA